MRSPLYLGVRGGSDVDFYDCAWLDAGFRLMAGPDIKFTLLARNLVPDHDLRDLRSSSRRCASFSAILISRPRGTG